MIDVKKILKHLKTNKKIEVLDEVSSTNDYIKDADLDAVIALSQSNGKGTNNRKFFSPKGGVYLSVKIKNPNFSAEKLSLVTPYFAVVTLKAIELVAKIKAEIKWVNDVYIKGKKVAGILCESKIENDKIEYIVIGVGINVKKQNFPKFILNSPTSIEEETNELIDYNRLIAELLKGANDLERSILAKDFISIYKENFYLLDKSVTAKINGEEICGKVVGVDNNLNLQILRGNELLTFNNVSEITINK